MLPPLFDRLLDWVWRATEAVGSKTAVVAFWRGTTFGMVLMALLMLLHG